GPKLLTGTGQHKIVVLVVVTSDRGLCGAFNGQVVREARKQIRAFEAEGRTVKIICAGRKGRDLLRRDHGKKIVGFFDDMSRKHLAFADAEKISRMLLDMFDKGEIDEAFLVYNRFKNVLTQIVTRQQLIPVPMPKAEEAPKAENTIPYD